jgi:mannose-6-phosphate isomerase-like protein (cupin superfamily)
MRHVPARSVGSSNNCRSESLEKRMREYRLEALLGKMDRGEQRAWHEFLRVPALSMGVYRLRAGEADRQSPHTEDEVYYVVHGRAKFRAGLEEREVEAGTVLYVERLVEHRFFEIREDLTVLVFFAPAEGSLRGGHHSSVLH